MLESGEIAGGTADGFRGCGGIEGARLPGCTREHAGPGPIRNSAPFHPRATFSAEIRPKPQAGSLRAGTRGRPGFRHGLKGEPLKAACKGGLLFSHGNTTSIRVAHSGRSGGVPEGQAPYAPAVDSSRQAASLRTLWHEAEGVEASAKRFGRYSAVKACSKLGVIVICAL
jgi:hypothetical protein